MSAKPLPDRPHLDQLRRQAKELRDAARTGDTPALERVHAHAPDLDPLSLATAQLVIAREYGFAGWPNLKAEVEARRLDLAERVETFLYSSCNWQTGPAARLLDDDPSIAAYDFRTAIVLGEADRVRRLIEREPEAVFWRDRRSGWSPLLGVCMSRWHQIDARRTDGLLEVARMLLEAGADPNITVGDRPGQPDYCSPLFAAAGCAANPALTALLLRHGAEPEEHTVYLAAFHQDRECLRMLLAHGGPVDDTALAAPITTGDAEVARMLLDAGADPARAIPAEALGEGHPGEMPVYAAVERECPVDLIELLLARGADPNVRGRDGLSPYRRAVRRGQTDIAELLVSHGARDDDNDADRLLDACLRGDRVAAQRLVVGDPGLPGRVAETDREALVFAADHGNLAAVRLMLELGFPVNDNTGETGATPLHAAAAAGSVEVVRLLIDHGADVEAHDATFESTPVVWASVGSGMHLGHCPRPDWVATIRLLVEAGTSVEYAWLDGPKAPSPEVAQLLRSYGVTGPDPI